jgi:hypothetical protein
VGVVIGVRSAAVINTAAMLHSIKKVMCISLQDSSITNEEQQGAKLGIPNFGKHLCMQN